MEDLKVWCINYEYHLEKMYDIINQHKDVHFKQVNIKDLVYFVRSCSSGKLNPYLTIQHDI